MSSPIDPARIAVRRARAARAMTWLAAAVGLAFVAAFFIQAGLFNLLLPRPELPKPSPNPDQINATQSTVSGMDRQNQPYEVRARRGWQDEATPTLVHLEGPEGRFRRAEGGEYTLVAETGLYDTKVKTLDLAGSVVLSQADRFSARMDKAQVVVEEKKLVSQSKVDVTFGSGHVAANAMQITDDGSRILFLNGVTARFDAFDASEGKGDPRP